MKKTVKRWKEDEVDVCDRCERGTDVQLFCYQVAPVGETWDNPVSTLLCSKCLKHIYKALTIQRRPQKPK